MKRLLSIICLLILCAASVKAQSNELNKLVNMVYSLKNGGEKAYNAAVSLLAADSLWTPLNELKRNSEVECRTSDRVPGFQLNSIMNNAASEVMYQTSTGNFLNGADPRYNYSLIERTLKPHSTVTFNLPERWGGQIIMIIPYGGDAAKISAEAKGDTAFDQTHVGNGTQKLTGKASKNHPLELTITNGSDENCSYVIINYNSRK